MTFRKILFWMHLAAGSVAGIVILIMSVTGVLLTYQKQILAWSDTRAAGQGAAWSGVVGGAGKSVEALLSNVRNTTGVLPSTLTLHSDQPSTVALGDKGTMLISPTGDLLGPQPTDLRAFFRSVEDWHRWLAAGTEARNLGKSINDAGNLIFLLIVVGGLYLWMPRKWKWNNVRAVTMFRGGLAGKARDFNWHNVAGFWCFVPLFFVVLSGVVMSYPWASNLVYTMNGMQPPPPGQGKNKGKDADRKGSGSGKDRGNGEARGEGRGDRERAGQTAEIAEVNLAGLDAAVAKAQQQVPEWRTLSFPIPRSEQAPIVFAMDTGNGGQPQLKSTLTVNRATAEVVKWDRFQDQEKGRQARTWFRFMHTGEYYGIIGQTIAGIASLGGALLVYTGLALALRRFRAWTARDKSRVREPELAGVGQR